MLPLGKVCCHDTQKIFCRLTDKTLKGDQLNLSCITEHPGFLSLLDEWNIRMAIEEFFLEEGPVGDEVKRFA